MIQKLNNVSFKGIYPLYSMTGIDSKNYNKLLPVINMDDEFPNNDIFLGRTPKNNLLVEVREKDNTAELMSEEVYEASGLSLKEYTGIVKALAQMKNSYQNSHPENSYKTSTEKTLDQMDMMDIATAVFDAVCKFNEKFGNKPN